MMKSHPKQGVHSKSSMSNPSMGVVSKVGTPSAPANQGARKGKDHGRTIAILEGVGMGKKHTGGGHDSVRKPKQNTSVQGKAQGFNKRSEMGGAEIDGGW